MSIKFMTHALFNIRASSWIFWRVVNFFAIRGYRLIKSLPTLSSHHGKYGRVKISNKMLMYQNSGFHFHIKFEKSEIKFEIIYAELR